MNRKPTFSILICSLMNRYIALNELTKELKRQAQDTDRVEVLIEIDDGQITIGVKRNLLLSKAKGDYIAFVDDDDKVSEDYISKILKAIETKPDCCSLEGILIRPGRKYEFYHSIKYDKWFEKEGRYYRHPNHLNAVKRELALQIGFPEMDVGEDFEYSTRLKPLLKTEASIKGILYYYVKDKKWRR